MRKFVLRPLIAIFGIVAIGWAVSALRVYATDASLAETANSILSGDRFNSAQLASIRSRLAAVPSDLGVSSAVRSTAIMRVLLLGEQLKSGNRELSISEYDRLQSNLTDALARSPNDPFLWLSAFWSKGLRVEPAANNLNLLRMSFQVGPNEGWIAFKRAGVAFGVFSSLPPDLADHAVLDFVELVRWGFYSDAADILQGPGWAIRDRLLNSLVAVDLSGRQTFAKTLAAKDIEELPIPGVETPLRRF